MAYVCKDCRQLVQTGTHDCPGREHASAVSKNLWGLPKIDLPDLTRYNFPTLAEILEQMNAYIRSLELRSGRGWPALSLTLKLTRPITDPGMVLMLGNPREVIGGCECEVMNNKLPGIPYRVKHSQYKGPSWFSFTNLGTASEFFQKTGAINIMPSDASWAGDKPASQVPEGRILVNAHSKCAAGLLIHEIVHAYGGPAGMFGEGLTDWFTIDLMKQWGKQPPYTGNPAYAYNVSLVQRLADIAGPERVARMAFSGSNAWVATKAKMPKRMPSGKDIEVNINLSHVLAQQAEVTSLALKAQGDTMDAAGFGDKKATMIPLPATADKESAAGLPGAISRLGDMLVRLMPR